MGVSVQTTCYGALPVYCTGIELPASACECGSHLFQRSAAVMDVCRLWPQPPVAAAELPTEPICGQLLVLVVTGGHDFKEEPCLAMFDRMAGIPTQSQAFGLPPSRPRFVRRLGRVCATRRRKRQFWRERRPVSSGPLPSSGSPQRSRSPGRRAVSSPFVQCVTRPRGWAATVESKSRQVSRRNQ